MTPGDGDKTTIPAGNVAMGGSFVRDQIIVNGDLHKLFVTRDDTPEEKLRVARNHLDRGDAERADELIVDAIARKPELLTAEVAYLRVLAMVHGRSVDDLDVAGRRKIDDCFARIPERVDDEWCEALGVVQELVACLAAQEERGGRLDAERFDQVMDRLDKLLDGRREEIMRHLDVLLAGARSDRADRMVADLADERRMADDRKDRVPLFFEPDPVEPRRFPVEPPPRFGARVWVSLFGGAAAAVTGALVLVATAARVSLLGTAVILVLWAWSGAVLRVDGPDYLYRRWRRAEKERAIGGGDAAGHAPGAWGTPTSTRFANTVGQFVRRWFVTEPPVRSDSARLFVGSTAGLRTRLRDEIVLLYDATGQQRVRPERVEWLVRWHAGQAARQWEHGTLYGPSDAVPAATRVRLVAGLVALSAGCLLGLDLAASADVVRTVLAAVLLGVGGRTAFVNHLKIHRGRRAHRDDAWEFEQRFDGEQVGYRQRKAELDRRPTEPEMARWLHWDRVNLRLGAMGTLGLGGKDLVTSFVLAEGLRDGPRARIGNGPMRYLGYALRAFLLTENGVRAVEMRLDFAAGALNGEQRTSFGYRAISWAQMGERTVRARGRRQAAELVGGSENRSTRPVRSQKLALTLTSGKEIVMHATHEPEPTADGEDPSPTEPSGDDSGDVVAALRFLEAVVADGSAWVRREQRRRRQRRGPVGDGTSDGDGSGTPRPPGGCAPG